MVLLFQHTAARRRLSQTSPSTGRFSPFQHTAARRRLTGSMTLKKSKNWAFQHTAARRRLNVRWASTLRCTLFQHTAARRRLKTLSAVCQMAVKVSTHSRPKAADCCGRCCAYAGIVSTHSRPKAADFPATFGRLENSSFNTQPPEGG